MLLPIPYRLDWDMLVLVVPTRVVKSPIDKVVDVIAVHGLGMATALGVLKVMIFVRLACFVGP